MTATRARKRFGQHFLVDRGAIGRIVKTLAAGPDDSVLEIGPGRGALTGALVESGAVLAAVEIDRDLLADLRLRFPLVRFYESDVLQLDLAAVRADLDPEHGRRLRLAGNLPYNISKPIAMQLIDQRAQIESAVLMFQREVAERLTAAPHSRAYGPLTVLAGLAFDIRRVFDLPPAAFRPRPAVHSTVTAWRKRDSSPLTPATETALRRCLSASFAHRRQTLRNNLRAALHGAEAADRVLARSGLDGACRAEAIPPAGFLALAAAWPAPSPAPEPSDPLV